MHNLKSLLCTNLKKIGRTFARICSEMPEKAKIGSFRRNARLQFLNKILDGVSQTDMVILRGVLHYKYVQFKVIIMGKSQVKREDICAHLFENAGKKPKLALFAEMLCFNF